MCALRAHNSIPFYVQYFRYYFLSFPLKIESRGYLIKKYTPILWGKIYMAES